MRLLTGGQGIDYFADILIEHKLKAQITILEFFVIVVVDIKFYIV